MLALAGCQGGGVPRGEDAASGADAAGGMTETGMAAAVSRSDAMPKARVRISPSGGDGRVGLDDPVSVRAKGGLLTDVVVTRGDGSRVPGDFTAEKTRWSASGALRPDTEYRVRAEAVNAQGARSAATEKFRTLEPETELTADIHPDDGATVGVGMPIVVTFDEPVTRKAAVERRLRVRSSKPVEGAWHWFTDTEVHYRPREYWPAHSEVNVRVDLAGVHAGNGLWGLESVEEEFTIGRSVITKVNLHKHRARVYVDGEHARTIPVTGGQSGWRTRDGTKLILDKVRDKQFTDEMIDAAEDYDLFSPYALRVTWSGEFLHTASWSVPSHGEANVSHGCVGMNLDDSRWLYEVSQYGAPVEMDTEGSEMAPYGNGYGDWNLSWKEWTAGSALAS